MVPSLFPHLRIPLPILKNSPSDNVSKGFFVVPTDLPESRLGFKFISLSIIRRVELT